MDEGDDLAFEAISARGNSIVTLGDDVVTELRAVGEAVTRRWIEEMNGLGLDGQMLVDHAPLPSNLTIAQSRLTPRPRPFL